MKIHVTIHPYLRQSVASPHNLVSGETRDVPEGTTAAEFADLLGLPKRFPVIILVNGVSCTEPARTLLKEEDIVLVSPVMAGG